jgi:peptidoglycan/xylan/chitin deacetylase (PgdA/CDA1 family)
LDLDHPDGLNLDSSRENAMSEDPSAVCEPQTSFWVADQLPTFRCRCREAGIMVASGLAVALNQVLGRRARGNPGILTYHRVIRPVPGLPRPLHNVTPERFREQLSGLLRRGFRFWPLRQLLAARATGQEVPPQTVVVTFDDGYESVHAEALPVLRDLNVPATVFLNTAYLDRDDPFPVDVWGLTFRDRAPRETYRPLSLAQCRELLQSGLVELGAHTHTHQDFRHRPDALQQDLQTNVDLLRSYFGLQDMTFAFPFGRPRLGFASPELMVAARKTGVLCALTMEARVICLESDPFGWGRFNAFSWDSSATLAAKLNGWFEWAPKLVLTSSKRLSGTYRLPNSRDLTPRRRRNPSSGPASGEGQRHREA